MTYRIIKHDRLITKFLFRYTFIFGITVLIVFSWFFLTGKTLIWYADGLTQHYNALLFYGEHLRTILRTVFVDHSFEFPSYSFSIGEGGDILTVLHYYAIGDPLCALAVFFTGKNMYVLYDLIVVIRLYCSGLAFAYLCKVTGKNNVNALLTGALSYAFCFWALYNSPRHTMFLVPMIILPLILAGTEQVINQKNPFLLIVAVFVAALSNFYFFYMMVIMTAIYTFIRLFDIYGKDIKNWLSAVKRMFIYSLTSVMAAGVVIVPVMYAFASDARNSGVNEINWTYPIYYYLSLPKLMLTPEESFWLCLSLTITQIVAVMALIYYRKSHKTLMILSVLCFLFILIPFFGQLFNGMSYMSNRWCFALILLCSYVLTSLFDRLISNFAIYKKAVTILIVVLIVHTAITGDLRKADVIVSICLLLLFTATMMFLIAKKKSYRTRSMAVVVFTISSVILTAFFLYDPKTGNYASETRNPDEISSYYYDDGTIANKLLNNVSSFYRYSGNGLQWNSSLNKGVSSTCYYWSLTNSYQVEFKEALQLQSYLIHENMNYDNRTILTDMSSVCYYLVPNGQTAVPYNYTLKETYDNYDVFINQKPISLCFSSENVIRKSYWNTLNASQKEEALLYGIVIPDETETNLTFIEPSLETQNPPVSYVYDRNKITINPDGGIDVHEDMAILRIDFEGIPDSETHLVLKGICSLDLEDTMVVSRSSSGAVNYVELHEKGFSFYNGRHDFVLNMGYCEEPVEWIAIVFTEKGKYTFDDISVSCIPMGHINDHIDSLNQNVPDLINIGTDVINCSVSLERPEMLVFTIPYSEGWSAQIDGKEAEIINADVKYMSLLVSEGDHEITLRYRTPFFTEGVIFSVLGVIAITVEIVIYKKKSALSRHKKKTSST